MQLAMKTGNVLQCVLFSWLFWAANKPRPSLTWPILGLNLRDKSAPCNFRQSGFCTGTENREKWGREGKGKGGLSGKVGRVFVVVLAYSVFYRVNTLMHTVFEQNYMLRVKPRLNGKKCLLSVFHIINFSMSADSSWRESGQSAIPVSQ